MKKFLCLACLLAFYLTVWGQQGTVDASFGTAGWTLIPHNNSPFVANTAYALALQPDGKIVAAGAGRWPNSQSGFGWELTRLNANGTPDAGFGSSGVVRADPSEFSHDGGQSTAYGVALQPDGKMVVVGELINWYDFSVSMLRTAVMRFNADGSPDASFDLNGKLVLQLSSTNASEGARDVVIQPDGRIVIVGTAYQAATYNMFVIRLMPNGSFDNSFNGNGKVYLNFGSTSLGYSVKLQPDGKIVAAGRAMNGSGNYDIALARINSDGTADNSFDVDGKVLIDFSGTNDAGFDLELQTNGKMIVAGNTQNATLDGALIRVNSDGSPDATFDGDGKLGFNGGGSDALNAVSIQPDGKIITIGTYWQSTNPTTFINKFNADGSPDNSFDGDGMGYYKQGTQGVFEGQDMILQADGKIVAGGWGTVYIVPSDPSGRVFTRIQNSSAVAAPLPVLFSSFSAKPAGNKVVLDWTTETEVATEAFDIEHCTDGRTFRIIGTTKAAGNSSAAHSYQFFHNDPLEGWNYYRLVARDIDGSRQIGEVRAVRLGSSLLLRLYPNPAGNQLTVSFSNDKVERVAVFDLHGRKLFDRNCQRQSVINLDLASWPAGNYVLTAYDKNGSSSFHFLRE